MQNWLMLIFKVPREPTAGRVYVWRKLKQVGALLVQDSVWALPDNLHTQEQLEWLAAEIAELKGDATLIRSQLLNVERDAELASRFREQAEAAYQEVLVGLKHRKRDLPALSRRFQQAQELDFFNSPFAARTRKALLAAQGEK